MIKLYYSNRCQSSTKACLWFKAHGLEVEKKKLDYLSRQDLMRLLALTDQGMAEILKHKGKVQTAEISNFLHSDLSFEEALYFLSTHSDWLRSPIILSENKYMVGYNHEEIRKFLPRDYRRMEVS